MRDADIYQDLQDRLTNGDLPHGQKLKPTVLCQDYGVAASTLREALFRLSAKGLVEFQEQRGFRVPAMSPPHLNDLMNMRIMLETEGAILSMRQGGLPWEARLSAAHHQLLHIERRIRDSVDKVGYFPLWLTAEAEFHETMIAACGSEVLKELFRSVYARVRQQLITEDRRFVRLGANIDHHRLIVEAVLAGDEAGVRTYLRAHLARS